jgi:hypothetical protein
LVTLLTHPVWLQKSTPLLKAGVLGGVIFCNNAKDNFADFYTALRETKEIIFFILSFDVQKKVTKKRTPLGNWLLAIFEAKNPKLVPLNKVSLQVGGE